MIKTFRIITAMILLPVITFSQSSPQKFTPRQMREDIDTLVKYLEQTQPNIYYRYPRDKFYKDVEAVKQNFTKDLTLVDFYLKAEPLLGKLEDGHTDFQVMQQFKSLNPFMLPYSFTLSVNKPFIVCTGAYTNIKTQIPANAEIISINNIPAKKMVDDIVDLNTGENRPFRAEFGAGRFYFYLEALYKANGKYSIAYRYKGVTKTVLIKGIRRNTALAAKPPIAPENKTESNFALKILEKDKTAIIDFKSFEWDGYKSFIDSAFTLIKTKGIKNLVINLIGDEGGDSDIGDDLFQYLSDKPFRQYDQSIVKNSRFLKERLLAHRVGKVLDSADKALLARPSGTFDTIKYQNIVPANHPLRFDGRVYLLIDIETYSSASDFAQCFNYYKRGAIIGTETGGLIKSYGDIVPAKLPKTKLEMSISSTLYNDIGSGANDWHGVIPNIVAPPSKALDEALKLIRQQEK